MSQVPLQVSDPRVMSMTSKLATFGIESMNIVNYTRGSPTLGIGTTNVVSDT